MENNNRNAIVKKDTGAVIKYPEIERVVVEPLADLFETADGFVLKLDIPGAKKDKIRITSDLDRLVITAPLDVEPDRDKKILFSEIKPKVFARSFNLGDGIDTKGISASCENGVLTVNLPKNEDSKAREIKIK